MLSGFETHGFFISIIYYVSVNLASHLPSILQRLMSLVFGFLSILISLGGITVIAGGVALLARHSWLGRMLIALGGGAGFVGLAIGLAYYSFVSGLSGTVLHIEYWIGVGLAATARWLAGRRE